jgi:Holliday junction resolvasome RuvABC endonuclease subunit
VVIKLVSLDPALSNLGIAVLDYDLDADQLDLKSLRLVQTEASKHKTVRKNSDDLERARLLFQGMTDACDNCHIAIAEIPVGTQSARGAMSNGIALGVLAGCPIPLIQVSPTEAKMASVGIKTATKDEMIEWAMKHYPHKDWLLRRSKGQVVPLKDNEHLADAVAIAVAGVKTDQFRQAISFFRVASTRSLST